MCLCVPCCTSSDSRSLHSLRKMLAPVRLPSPPHTHRLVMPRCSRWNAADRRPSREVKALQRALPMMVPPWPQSHTHYNTSHEALHQIKLCSTQPEHRAKDSVFIKTHNTWKRLLNAVCYCLKGIILQDILRAQSTDAVISDLISILFPATETKRAGRHGAGGFPAETLTRNHIWTEHMHMDLTLWFEYWDRTFL